MPIGLKILLIHFIHCFLLDLTWLDPDFTFQLLRFVPVAGVGSRRLILLIPDLQAVPFCGSMPPRLQTFMSPVTQSDHVFLGLPCALEHRTSISVTYSIYRLIIGRRVQTIYSTAHNQIEYNRFRCGCAPHPVNWNFVVISPCFAIFKNVLHSLESGETPSYSASH